MEPTRLPSRPLAGVLAALCLASALSLLSPPPARASRGTVVFRQSDPSMDDYGPGSYRYPRARIFQESPGMFDIRDFQVTDEGDLVAFRIEFKNRIPKSLGGNGFSHMMIDIYIDRDRIFGSGIQRALAGRNVRFKPEEAWDACVLVTPARETLIREALREKSEDLEMVNFADRVLIPAVHNIDTHAIVVKVDKKKLGQPAPGWGYQALVMGFDPEDSDSSTFHNLQVKAFEGEFHFGGGADESGSPACIDCLAPKGSSQKAFLSAHYTHPNPALARLAFVPMCYSERGEFLKSARTEMKSPIPVAKAPEPPREDEFLARLRLERDAMPGEPDETESPKAGVSARPLPFDKPAEIAVTESRLTPSGSVASTVPARRGARKAAPTVDERLAEAAEKTYERRLAERGEGAAEPARLSPAPVPDPEPEAAPSRKASAKSPDGPGAKAPAAAPDKRKAGMQGFDPDLAGYLGDSDLTADSAFDTLRKGAIREAPQESPEPKKRKRSVLQMLRDKKEARRSRSASPPAAREPKARAADPDASPAETNASKRAAAKRTKRGAEDPATDGIPPGRTADRPAPEAAPQAENADPVRAGCAARAKELIASAETYHRMFPDDATVSMSDLTAAGLLQEAPRCPAGGRYVIDRTGEKFEVECLNVNGTGHGTVRSDR